MNGLFTERDILPELQVVSFFNLEKQVFTFN